MLEAPPLLVSPPVLEEDVLLVPDPPALVDADEPPMAVWPPTFAPVFPPEPLVGVDVLAHPTLPRAMPIEPARQKAFKLVLIFILVNLSYVTR